MKKTSSSTFSGTAHKDVLDSRRAGILLHPTSLPGPYPFGDIGHDAYRFVEFLAASGITVWQCLPLGPTHTDLSPYQSLSVNAGNPLLISLHWLADQGWLDRTHLDYTGQSTNRDFRQQALHESYLAFKKLANTEVLEKFQAFKQTHRYWLDDYALFIVIRNLQEGQKWLDWPEALRNREMKALNTIRQDYNDALEQVEFEQFVFFTQWLELRNYAHEHDVRLFGDIPIFVAHDSADVWAHRDYFAVDKEGQPTTIAGVPPDYFSETGQRWGNPHYNWPKIQASGFEWWLERVKTQLELFDLIRIDHFRGLEAYWEIPAHSETAIDGKWVKAPGEMLLKALLRQFGELPLVAEDLGIITDEVIQLRDKFELPGMKILQFAFDGNSANAYLPHNHVPNCIVYTGTHDNDTTLGWFSELGETQKEFIDHYLGYPVSSTMPWPFIHCAFASVAKLAIIPLQDILGLTGEARMNTPGTTQNNWQWRFTWSAIVPEMSQRLKNVVELYQR